WFAASGVDRIPDGTAMALATATPDGAPSVRMVLLRGFDQRGFVFFTNYESRKGRELAANPRAALLFYWAEQGRQVRVEGRVERVEPEESDAYFASRPRGNQLASWASHQSRPLAGRAELEQAWHEAERRFADGPVPRPPYFGGFRLVPEAFEFWQRGDHRLHERRCCTRGADGAWEWKLLYP
ncbi:MAG TPA: pyridoxamine 5'-phosphate oxidase, partial [Bacillota bacterium]